MYLLHCFYLLYPGFHIIRYTTRLDTSASIKWLSKEKNKTLQLNKVYLQLEEASHKDSSNSFQINAHKVLGYYESVVFWRKDEDKYPSISPGHLVHGYFKSDEKWGSKGLIPHLR